MTTKGKQPKFEVKTADGTRYLVAHEVSTYMTDSSAFCDRYAHLEVSIYAKLNTDGASDWAQWERIGSVKFQTHADPVAKFDEYRKACHYDVRPGFDRGYYDRDTFKLEEGYDWHAWYSGEIIVAPTGGYGLAQSFGNVDILQKVWAAAQKRNELRNFSRVYPDDGAKWFLLCLAELTPAVRYGQQEHKYVETETVINVAA